MAAGNFVAVLVNGYGLPLGTLHHLQ